MGHAKENKTRDILVKFTSIGPRDNLYQRRKLLRDTTEPVYLNEDLTQNRSQLFYKARKLRRQGRIFGVWSQQGNILIKIDQNSQPRAVSDYNEITVLIEKQSTSTDTDSDQEVDILEYND